MAFGKDAYFRLPLSETFFVEEVDGKLLARHHMQVAGIHFLKIDYEIEKKQGED